MLVELVTTGSELLLGEILNDNVRFLSQELNKLGYSVIFHTTVGDNAERMEAVLRTALSRADIVITSGGLGPTQGDITKQIGAKVLDRPMILHPEIQERLRKWFQKRQTCMTSNNDRQAMIPEGAHIFTNEQGTAPGVAMEQNGKLLVHLPGPPRELRWMYTNCLKPYLIQTYGSQGCISSLIMKIYDMGESTLEEQIMDFIKGQSNPTIAMYAKPGYMELRLTARAQTEEEAQRLLQPLEKQLRHRLQRSAITYNDETMAQLLGRELRRCGYTVSCAESCTGGLTGSYITDVAGSSAYFYGSAGTYSNDMKIRLLQVKKETLDRVGAVSRETAEQMAQGACRLYGTELAISTTGIAGPDGGSADKPVGLVYIGIAGPQGTRVFRNVFIGDRREIKHRAATRALYYAVQYLRETVPVRD